MLKSLFMRGKLNRSLIAFILAFAFTASSAAFFLGKYVMNEILITNNLKNYLSYTHEGAERSIKSFLDTLNLYANDIVNDKEIFSIIIESKDPTDKKAAQVNDILARMLNNNQTIVKVAIVSKNSQVYSFSQQDVTIDAYDTSFIDRKASYDIFLSDQVVKDEDGSNYLVFGKNFINFYSNYDLGHLLIYVKETSLNDTFKGAIVPDIEAFLTLGDIVISHNDKTKLSRYLYIPNEFADVTEFKKISNGKFIIKTHKFTNIAIKNLSLTSIISYKALHNSINNFNINMLILIFINILFAVVLSGVLTKKLTSSMTDLQKKMSLYGSGKQVDILPPKNTEIIALENSFRKMIVEIDTLMEKNVESEKKIRNAELAALQAQINPHFIYNALDAISWMGKIKKQTEIVDATQKLAQFFRISLHKGENFITIEEELQHIKSYIAIEQIRFPDLFTVEYNISDDILHLKTIKIILQPLIENSIKHGFNKLNKLGIIKVQGFKDGDDVIFEISDNGKGMDWDSVKVKRTTSFSGGYGILNVQERIELEYGAGYGLTYSSVIGEGTTVVVKIKPKYM